VLPSVINFWFKFIANCHHFRVILPVEIIGNLNTFQEKSQKMNSGEWIRGHVFWICTTNQRWCRSEGRNC